MCNCWDVEVFYGKRTPDYFIYLLVIFKQKQKILMVHKLSSTFSGLIKKYHQSWATHPSATRSSKPGLLWPSGSYRKSAQLPFLASLLIYQPHALHLRFFFWPGDESTRSVFIFLRGRCQSKRRKTQVGGKSGVGVRCRVNVTPLEKSLPPPGNPSSWILMVLGTDWDFSEGPRWSASERI